jgi:hypothetical protein
MLIIVEPGQNPKPIKPPSGSDFGLGVVGSPTTPQPGIEYHEGHLTVMEFETRAAHLNRSWAGASGFSRATHLRGSP